LILWPTVAVAHETNTSSRTARKFFTLIFYDAFRVLQVLRTDSSGLVPQSQAWCAHRYKQFDRYMAGELHEVLFPIEVISGRRLSCPTTPMSARWRKPP
jgi:hypothetical protein